MNGEGFCFEVRIILKVLMKIEKVPDTEVIPNIF